MLFHGVWYPVGLCSGGPDTPQDFVKRGIRPRKTLCGVSDPAEQVYAIHKIYTTLPLFCRVWYPARLGSVVSDTRQDLVLWGLIPRRVLFCGVSYPAGKLRPHRTRRKSFESFPFSLKGHFLKIVCMYKLHYPSHIGSMLKEPPIWKICLCSTGSDTRKNNFEIWISPRIRTRIKKMSLCMN